MERREALKQGFSIVSLAVAGGFAYGEFANATPVLKLRPPGARSEDEFLALCVRCGLCVEACPFDTLKLAQFKDAGVGIGTPFFTPRKIPCKMCIDIPCVDRCPTSALDPSPLKDDAGRWDINRAKMGMAIVDDKVCIAYHGLRCEVCYRACPLIDKALKLEYRHNERTGKHALLLPIVDTDICTGCGMCEQVCVTKKSSISIVPREYVAGVMNDTYVKGWKDGDEERVKGNEQDIKLNLKKGIKALNEEVER